MTKEEVIELAKKIIAENKFAIVGTTNLMGYPNVRALKVMKNENYEVFYFSTRANSYKIKQMKRKPKGCIYFYNTEKFESVMMEGNFKVEENRNFEISDIYKIDYDDPFDFAVIKFFPKTIYVYTHFQSVKLDVKDFQK